MSEGEAGFVESIPFTETREYGQASLRKCKRLRSALRDASADRMIW
jgi:hypothetical protein